MTLSLAVRATRKKAVWGPRRLVTALTIATLALTTNIVFAAPQQEPGQGGPGQGSNPSHPPSPRANHYRLDPEVERLSHTGTADTNSFIVALAPGATLPAEFAPFVRRKLGKLDIINGIAIDLPNNLIQRLADRPEVVRIHHDRPIRPSNLRTAVTVGAVAARSLLGYTGAGVSIAVIDSGITTWHDDLTGKNGPYGNQRVAKFVDFIGGQTQPYDDNGHGTHVAGIIAGNGYDSNGEKAGIAPEASIVSLKVLDADGRGTIGGVIGALNWIAAHHKTYNIRVVNVSVGALALESYWTDPLTLAVKTLVDRGIVVVAAAGNFGKNSAGELQYGGITAPANAPWVLTVGASSTRGTFAREDDEVAGYSSSGPTAVDFLAKPDLVAPGTGTVSLAAPGSMFYSSWADYLVSGSRQQAAKPYLTLSGTSMAAPVVSGTVALMLQANPKLTPNLVKAILQYTAEEYPGYNPLRQGAGFLNSFGAITLAKFYADARVGSVMPVEPSWSQQILWGNYRLVGGYLNPKGNAWDTDIVWGATQAANWGDNIIWGTQCEFCDNIIWGTADFKFENIVSATFFGGDWGTAGHFDNIIWGTFFGGDWGTGGHFDNIIWGTFFGGDWGTGGHFDNIIWGTDCGGANCANVVWGAWGVDNIIWGTADFSDNIIWGTNFSDNIIWGTSFLDNIIWGTGWWGTDNILWGTSGGPGVDGELTTMFPEEGREALNSVLQQTVASISKGGL
jgi:serine protease AprX